MRKDKYKDPIKREVVDDNIKMEVPDEAATDMAKKKLRRRLTLLRFVMCAKEFWGRLSLVQHIRLHEGIQHQCDKWSYKTPTKKYRKGPINRIHSGKTFE